MSADKDALIRGIGELLVRDIATAGHDLDGYALIVSYADGARRISGFGYRDGEAPRAATPQTGLDTIGARLDELREATQAEGKALYGQYCAPCHRPDGGGIIGPNLADDYWLHGGRLEDIYRTVAEGELEKGMPPWSRVLKPDQLNAVTVYVASLHGTNPPAPKDAQGEKVDGPPR